MLAWNDFLAARQRGENPARIGVVGLAFDANSSFLTGAAAAPALIRQAFYSDAANLWSERGYDLGAEGVFADLDDRTFMPDAMPDSVTHLAADVLEQGLHLLSLGGDHSLTFPLVQAASKQYPNLTLVHLDAHSDLYDDFGGNPHSHASPFARIMETELVEQLIQIGIRTLNGEQRQQVTRFGVEVFAMQAYDHRGVLEHLHNLNSPVYLSLDMDVLDPAFAPGVSHREAGGLSTRQVIDLIHAIRAPIVAADLVEFNPIVDMPARDPNGLTAMTAAKLFKELSAQMLVCGLPT